MTDPFVQVNTTSPLRRHHPVGYRIRASGCWEWTASVNSKGYAQIRVAGRKVLFHRLMYERHRGPIPLGLTIDHLCRNRICGNPAHLEVTTIQENVRRGNRHRRPQQGKP